jgi:glycosyltransferase involved in cell wall biosynthesis
MEGGAKVVSEALALETPVLASDIPGNRGLLPDNYSGLFPVEDDSVLAESVRRFQREESFRKRLRNRIKTMDPDPASPGREERKWRDLMEELIAVPS